MSIVICPDCGKEKSDKAPSCPHCGYQAKSGCSKVARGIIEWVGTIIALIILGVLYLIFFQK